MRTTLLTYFPDITRELRYEMKALLEQEYVKYGKIAVAYKLQKEVDKREVLVGFDRSAGDEGRGGEGGGQRKGGGVSGGGGGGSKSRWTPEPEDVGEEIQQGAGHPKMSETDVLRESDEVLTTRLKKEFNRCFLNYQHVAEQYKWEEDQQVYTYIYIYVYK